MKNFKHTIYACYIGIVVQAVINNLAPLLFLTFQKQYNISYEQIGLLVTVNFGTQFIVDFLCMKFLDRIGYRVAIVIAHIFATIGLLGLGILPEMFDNPYTGLLVAVLLYAVGSGIIEVVVSPLVEACPTEKKSAQMSLLHSFYCWGHVLVVLLSTLFFQVVGIGNWKYLTILWAVLPILNGIYFLFVPLNKLVDEEKALSMKQVFSMKIFWVFVLLMLCAGAAEQAMSQWASAFAEAGLKVSKTMGDLLGPCMFAVCMGLARALYATFSSRIKLRLAIGYSAVLCMFCYLVVVFSPNPIISLIACAVSGFSVGILWPGVYSMAMKECPYGGITLFAMLALAGDAGCTSGPAVVGTMADLFDGSIKSGMFFALIFPAGLFIGIIGLSIAKRRRRQRLE